MNFREGASTNTVDSSSNTLTAQLNNGTAWVSNRNGAGNAVNFDGVNDDITLAVPSEGLFDFDATSTFAVIVVLMGTGFDDNARVIVSKIIWPDSGWVFHTGDSTNRLGIYTRQNATTYHYWNAGTGIKNAIFKNGRWHTVAFVYRGINTGVTAGDGKEFYFDGVSYTATEQTTGPGGAPSALQNNAQLRIGGDDTATLPYMINNIGCVLVSRDGYAPDAKGMKDMHNRLMGIVGKVMQ